MVLCNPASFLGNISTGIPLGVDLHTLDSCYDSSADFVFWSALLVVDTSSDLYSKSIGCSRYDRS